MDEIVHKFKYMQPYCECLKHAAHARSLTTPPRACASWTMLFMSIQTNKYRSWATLLF